MFILEALEHYAETDRIAIRYHDEKVSFSALNRMADAFAAYLRRTLPSDGRPVMIYGHKQSAIPACMFGALKAGRGYIPVDTTYPTDRAAQILRDAQPSVLVDLCYAFYKPNRLCRFPLLILVFHHTFRRNSSLLNCSGAW